MFDITGVCLEHLASSGEESFGLTDKRHLVPFGHEGHVHPLKVVKTDRDALNGTMNLAVCDWDTENAEGDCFCFQKGASYDSGPMMLHADFHVEGKTCF